ncbi:MAG: pyridoxal-dependent decarboxylase [Pseudomonadota bacterium]
MEHSLAMFSRITSELLDDEAHNPVAAFIPSSELYDRLDLSLSAEGVDADALEKALKDVVLASPRTATPAFFNQLFGGRTGPAILGDLLSVMLNNSMATYKAAGPQVGVEKTVIREVCNLIGWGEASGGTFAPGGSMTNLMGMIMARDAANPDTRQSGVDGRMIAYTSTESHYSAPKNAAFSGIGRDNVRSIATDETGRMDMTALRTAITADIKDGHRPFLINCTSGTTVLGAYDDLSAAADVAEEFDLWLHVDGAYGGSALFSDQYRHLIRGVERVDSFTINAHKMLGTPLSCSMIFVKDASHLHASFSNEASYLYQTDHDDFNLGKMSLQCGRRNDALKLWALWKSVGTNGLAAYVEQQFALADQARAYVREHPDYTDYSVDDTVAVCFNYKGIDPKILCTALYEHEQLLVGYGSFRDDAFVRLVTVNGHNQLDDMSNFFQTLEAFVSNHPDLFV